MNYTFKRFEVKSSLPANSAHFINESLVSFPTLASKSSLDTEPQLNGPVANFSYTKKKS